MRIKLIIEGDKGGLMDVYRLGPKAIESLFGGAIQDVIPVRRLWRTHEGWAVANMAKQGVYVDDGTAYPDRCEDNAVAAAIKFGAS